MGILLEMGMDESTSQSAIAAGAKTPAGR